jgi:hypothetical protein
MFGVSWDLHEVYELDPTGKNEPVPLDLPVILPIWTASKF